MAQVISSALFTLFIVIEDVCRNFLNLMVIDIDRPVVCADPLLIAHMIVFCISSDACRICFSQKAVAIFAAFCVSAIL